jgi:hypothetical protein
MPVQRAGLRLEDIVDLLNNQEFIADSRDYWGHYKAQSERIGLDRLEWERQAPDFMSKFLDPFAEKWGGVYPPPDELLSSPLRLGTQSATMTGRWGIIPVYPWTTEKEVKNRMKNIQRAIGKEHQDFRVFYLSHVARWLRDFYISPKTGRPPGLGKIAAAVWGRKKGLRRPSKRAGIASLSVELEAKLMQRYIAKGKTRQEATRLIYQRARGSEAPASAMVRMALNRLRDRRIDTDKAITDPQKTDQLGLAITMILRELPTSESSHRDLQAICTKAVELGNLLLPPESPA